MSFGPWDRRNRRLAELAKLRPPVADGSALPQVSPPSRCDKHGWACPTCHGESMAGKLESREGLRLTGTQQEKEGPAPLYTGEDWAERAEATLRAGPPEALGLTKSDLQQAAYVLNTEAASGRESAERNAAMRAIADRLLVASLLVRAGPPGERPDALRAAAEPIVAAYEQSPSKRGSPDYVSLVPCDQMEALAVALRAQIPNQRMVEEAYRKAGEVSTASLDYEVRGPSGGAATP